MTAGWNEPFVHSLLDLSKPQVRLLQLLPPSNEHPLRCRIDQYPFSPSDNAVGYKAISYEWGDPTIRKLPIELNGQTFKVGRNLHDFLSILVEKHDCLGPCNLWVDAICIDQTNVEEKNHQVGQMADIYRRAEEVLVWLGLERADSGLVFQDLNGKLYAGLTKTAVVKEKLRKRRQLLDALRDLYRRTYWTRVWIVQEILLARHVTLFCGSEQLAWSVWLKHFDGNHSWHTYQPSSSRYTAATNLADLWQLRSTGTIRKSGRLSLDVYDLMLRLSYTRCSVRHDMVYAILGLAAWQSASRFEVDYEKPLPLLVLDVCRTVPEKNFWLTYKSVQRQMESSTNDLWALFQPRSLRSLDSDSQSAPDSRFAHPKFPGFQLGDLAKRYWTDPSPLNTLREAVISSLSRSDDQRPPSSNGLWEDETSCKARRVTSDLQKTELCRDDGWQITSTGALRHHDEVVSFYSCNTTFHGDLLPKKWKACVCQVCKYYRALYQVEADIVSLLRRPRDEVDMTVYNIWASCDTGFLSLDPRPAAACLFYWNRAPGTSVYLASGSLEYYSDLSQRFPKREVITLYFDPAFAHSPVPPPTFEIPFHQRLTVSLHGGFYQYGSYWSSWARTCDQGN